MRMVRITALWCSSCLLMKNRWNQVFANYPDLEIIDYDFDEDESMIKKYNVGTTLPVVIIEAEGKEIDRMVGEYSKKQLAKKIGAYFDETS